MQVYSPSQRKDGRWDYTCSNSTGTYPIGYCHKAPFQEPYSPYNHYYFLNEAHYKTEQEKVQKHLDKYHTDGHLTAEAAEACHREYVLDNEVRVWKNEHEQKKCVVCEAWCQNQVEVGHFIHFYVCDAHNNYDGYKTGQNSYYSARNSKGKETVSR